MNRFSTFSKGGIHPLDNKSFSKDSPLKTLPLCDHLIVPMSQHLGAPATPLKSIGDRVEMGEMIGSASGFISANVHSPVSGEITDFKKIVLANGIASDCFVIKPDDIQPVKYDKASDWSKLSSEELIKTVKDLGIVGQGGATFATNVKLAVPEGCVIDALIINCVECEPFLTSDYRLALEKTEEFIEGILICKKIVNPAATMIGIEANKLDLADKLSSYIKEKDLDIEIKILKMKYPQGDEKQLIKACINREIPSGKLPSDVGAVVVNAGTAWAIYRGIVFGRPLIERVVTVSGPCIKDPSNFIVPIGTPVSYLIESAGGFVKEPDKCIAGGPMMGFSFYDMETPVSKGSGGFVFINDDKKARKTPCLSCGKCVAACPMGLEPTIMYRLITNGKYEEAMKNNLMDCKECGCCAFTCPAHLDLVQAFKLGKKLGRKK